MRAPAEVLALTVVFSLQMSATHGQSRARRIQEAKQALDYVDRIASLSGSCYGTGNTLSLVFNTSAWASYTDPAIKTASLLTQMLMSNNNSLDHVDAFTFYSMVRNNVHGDTLIFGSAIGLEPGVYSQYPIRFCPYAAKKRALGAIKAFDLGTVYDYHTNESEWYYELKIKDYSNVTRERDIVENNGTTKHYVQPVPRLEDGRWTYPYFDCGAGEIWMVTYSSPILSLDAENNTVFFGVATIDIELTKIDINQCDEDDELGGEALDVFRSTHNCQNVTTTCVPMAGRGFVRGAYLCQCKPGFYFPNTSSTVKGFSGFEIEQYFDAYNHTFEVAAFQCVPCARACEECDDATPCLYDVSLALRLTVMVLTVVTLLAIGAVSLTVFHFRKEMAIKTASPIFLQLMCLGAAIMCSEMFVLYSEPTPGICVVAIWPLHLGFFVQYGALLLKTWRISVIFKPGAVKRVQLPDKALMHRFLPLLVAVVLFLVLWSIFNPPSVQLLVAGNGRKFFHCGLTIATYVAYGCEALMLLFGVYLCFTVRKAPAHFNESKHITWSTYNAIILGSFILILTQSIALSAGPDVIFLLVFAQLQVFITITFVLIFTPKFWALYKGTQLQEEENREVAGPTTITGRVKKVLPPSVRSDTRDMASQTDSPPPSQPLLQASAPSSSRPPSPPPSQCPPQPPATHPHAPSSPSSKPPARSSPVLSTKDPDGISQLEFVRKTSATSKHSAKVAPLE